MNTICPMCAEMGRRGVEEPILALEKQMAINNAYVRFIVDRFGYEEATKIAAVIEAEVTREILKDRQ